LERCVYAGAIKVDAPKNTAAGTATQSAEQPKTQNYIASKIAELEKRRALVNTYVPYFSEPSTITVRDNVLAALEKELAYWQDLANRPVVPESSNKQSVDLNKM
ncbi:hypothetical protein, partial [Vibrio brasiliensis]